MVTCSKCNEEEVNGYAITQKGNEIEYTECGCGVLEVMGMGVVEDEEAKICEVCFMPNFACKCKVKDVPQ